MKLSLGFSTCPNDTFIFEALVNGKIDTGGLHFTPHLADVEELNQMVMAGELDVSKISYGMYSNVAETYSILDAGSALGNNNGPLLVSKQKIYPDEIPHLRIAIPGLHTTANLLFSIAFPMAVNKTPLLFSHIEEAVLDGEFDAGLIIHESRFTYAQKGLQKIIDLGEYWQQTYQQLIPLGGIVVRKNLPLAVQQHVSRLIRESVQTAFDHPRDTLPYIRKHACEMSDEVMQQHVDLYVNSFSLSLGEKGRQAIAFLLERGVETGLIPPVKTEIFVPLQK